MEPGDRQRYLRALPKVDELFLLPSLQSLLKEHSKPLIVESIRRAVDKKRQEILQSAEAREIPSAEMDLEKWVGAVKEELAEILRPSLRPVINATGVVLHTNLGRAPLAAEALRAYPRNGERVFQPGIRFNHRGARLALRARGGNPLPPLRGRIGAGGQQQRRGRFFEPQHPGRRAGSHRVARPAGGDRRVLSHPRRDEKSGARLVEVGTTNRTHLRDYEQALGEKTALLLRVHTSNFRILGFTAEVPLRELVALGSSKNLPVMDDLGSGCLIDLTRFGLDPEPTVQEAVQAGADVVTFSGDKLLGGPQAGIIVGKKRCLDPIKKNPLNRALRIDKLTLAGLESTLRFYLEGEQALSRSARFPHAHRFDGGFGAAIQTFPEKSGKGSRRPMPAAPERRFLPGGRRGFADSGAADQSSGSFSGKTVGRRFGKTPAERKAAGCGPDPGKRSAPGLKDRGKGRGESVDKGFNGCPE